MLSGPFLSCVGRRLHPDEYAELMSQTTHHFYAPLWPRVPREIPLALNVDFEPMDKYKYVHSINQSINGYIYCI